jgi:hypothetical protein
MIISGTKKKKPNKIDNMQKLIDSAGETQFKNIYKNLQVEIKDQIITKLLSKLNILNKQIEEYRQEITSLKNDLVYLLKRVILIRNEEKLNSSNLKKQNYYKLTKNYSSTSNNCNSICSPLNSTTQMKSFSYLCNQTDINNNNNGNKLSHEGSNLYPINNIQSDLDIKVRNYINSIYKHNFLKNDTNVNEYYSLNKKESLFEEIFQKKGNQKHTDYYIGTEPKVSKKNPIHINRSQRNISTSLIKRPIDSMEEKKRRKKMSASMTNMVNENAYLNDNKIKDELEENNFYNYEDENDKKNKIEKINIIIPNNNRGNNYLKVKKKSDDLNVKKNQLNNYKSFKNRTQSNGIISENNANKTCSYSGMKKKTNRTNHYLSLNRSPFIANKC